LGLFVLGKDGDHEQEVEEQALRAVSAFRVIEKSWEVFCKQNGQDPEALLVDKPGSGLVSPGGPIGPGILPFMSNLATQFLGDDPMDEQDIADMVSCLQAALDRLA
jgi:hypothetical protein